MYDWLHTWAGLAPKRIAIEESLTRRTATYAQLDERANRFAVALGEALGVGSGDRIAVLAGNRIEVFEALFGCVKLAAMLVPLNWRLAVPELRGIVEDSAPRVLLYDDEWAEVAAQLLERDSDLRGLAIGRAVASDHQGYDELLSAAHNRRPGPVALGSVSEILYTSGTTGRPKGVQITNRQVLFNAVNTSIACDLTSSDSCLAFLPLFHTGGLHCLATPILHRGGRVVLMPKFDPEASVSLLEGSRATTAIAVPTMYQMLRDAGLGARPVPAVRALLCGGAPLPLPLLEAYHDARLPLRQGYGLTEVGPNCFTLAPLEGPHRLGSVGRPAFHSEARLVDGDGSDVAADTPGELWLRGPHVTAGYWRQPQLTREVLDDGGWFRTGDTLRRTADGFYSVVGRKKDMFISGGENVYPAEVENVLSGHPGVHQVAVVGVPDDRWGQVGMAVLVGAPDAQGPLDLESVRRWARDRLAGYKVPKHWRQVDALPMSSTGKVSKPALLSQFDREL